MFQTSREAISFGMKNEIFRFFLKNEVKLSTNLCVISISVVTLPLSSVFYGWCVPISFGISAQKLYSRCKFSSSTFSLPSQVSRLISPSPLHGYPISFSLSFLYSPVLISAMCTSLTLRHFDHDTSCLYWTYFEAVSSPRCLHKSVYRWSPCFPHCVSCQMSPLPTCE